MSNERIIKGIRYQKFTVAQRPPAHKNSAFRVEATHPDYPGLNARAEHYKNRTRNKSLATISILTQIIDFERNRAAQPAPSPTSEESIIKGIQFEELGKHNSEADNAWFGWVATHPDYPGVTAKAHYYKNRSRNKDIATIRLLSQIADLECSRANQTSKD